jgi:acetyl esterase/lipase
VTEASGIDWEEALLNAPRIPDAATYPERWATAAASFRGRVAGEIDIPYGSAVAERLDIFPPEGPSRGLVVIVHGGFWRSFGKSDWSHLAAGACALGWTVALPGYALAPALRIHGMTAQIGRAIAVAAARVAGPIRLAGHSAGGHLVTRMICNDSPLPPEVAARVERVVSISGLHDLRPLRLHSMNADLGLDPDEAASESPVLHARRSGPSVTAWVGAAERPEFLRQSALLAEAWSTPDAPVPLVAEPGRHHFEVIEGLTDPDHPLCRCLAGD